jgi:hypothetical protein
MKLGDRVRKSISDARVVSADVKAPKIISEVRNLGAEKC